MTEEKARAIFAVAEIPVLKVWRLENLYYGGEGIQEDAKNLVIPSCYEQDKTLLPISMLNFCNYAKYKLQEPWWLVKTPFGLIQIGWRKRVINIDWSDTEVRGIITNDDVTKEPYLVHAWSEEKAIEYLKELRRFADLLPQLEEHADA